MNDTVEDIMLQHWLNMVKATCQYKKALWRSSILNIEKKLMSFSGMVLDTTALRNRLLVAESSLHQALMLRQMLVMERYNETMSLAVNRIAHELMNIGVQKKTHFWMSFLILAC